MMDYRGMNADEYKTVFPLQNSIRLRVRKGGWL